MIPSYIAGASPFIGFAFGAIADPQRLVAAFQGADIRANDTVQSFFSHPVLQTINSLKQHEIKNFALLTPLALLTAHLAYRTLFPKQAVGKESFSKQTTPQNPPWEQLAVSTLSIGLGMVANYLIRPLNTGGFDPSGHMMMGVISAQALRSVVHYIENKGDFAAATAGAALGAISTIPLMTQTTTCHHSLAECVAGLFLGSAISLASSFAVNRISPYLKEVFK